MTPQCRRPPTGLLHFCSSIDYPIDVTDLPWLSYLDAQLQYHFNAEVRPKGAPSGSACYAALRDVACARYFPRCTPNCGELREALPPCASLCERVQLLGAECPGADFYSSCAVVPDCCASDEQVSLASVLPFCT